jgi:hypothetical protein
LGHTSPYKKTLATFASLKCNETKALGKSKAYCLNVWDFLI